MHSNKQRINHLLISGRSVSAASPGSVEVYDLSFLFQWVYMFTLPQIYVILFYDADGSHVVDQLVCFCTPAKEWVSQNK